MLASSKNDRNTPSAVPKLAFVRVVAQRLGELFSMPVLLSGRPFCDSQPGVQIPLVP